MTVVFYISGHGFGHAARTIEVINALIVRRPDLAIHVRTRAARWLFDLTVSGAFTYTEADVDVGVVQVDALTPDLEATLARAAAFYGDGESLVEREADALRACDAALVIADVPPVAFAAAARAGVPSIALTNFTWDWIYRDYEEACGAPAGISDRIRGWQSLADEAWRLPMSGGFAGIARIRDLPFVARRSKRSRDETRAALGWDADRIVVLSSFGGIGMPMLPLPVVARASDLLVVTAEEPGGFDTGADELSRIGHGGVVSLNERLLYQRGWRYEDLVAAADVVVTKPGYGIIAECVANGAAMLYTSRGRFAEYDVLVNALPRWLRCRFIDQSELRAGAWADPIRRLLRQPAPAERADVTGAEVAASWADAWLCGRSPAGGGISASRR